MSDLNDEFNLDETIENKENDDTIDDDHKDTRTDLMEGWDNKFEEWKTPKKKLFLARLMQSINRYNINFRRGPRVSIHLSQVCLVLGHCT